MLEVRVLITLNIRKGSVKGRKKDRQIKTNIYERYFGVGRFGNIQKVKRASKKTEKKRERVRERRRERERKRERERERKRKREEERKREMKNLSSLTFV
jgi:hypothetical protein